MKTLIKSGRVVTAVDDYRADILIEDGTVSLIGKEINVEADVVIDASGKLVIPGGIDLRRIKGFGSRYTMMIPNFQEPQGLVRYFVGFAATRLMLELQ